MWDRNQALCVEYAFTEKADFEVHFESRIPDAGRVWHQGRKSTFLFVAPMLITKHGRTLAVIPRSTIHTSPRRGSFMDRFFFV